MSIATLTKRLLAPWRKKGVGSSILMLGMGETISDTAVKGRLAYKRNGFLARSVNAKAEAVASVPLKVYTEKEISGKVERQEVVSGELVDMLARPNKSMTSNLFWRSHQIEFGLMGNSLWYFPDSTKEIMLIRADDFEVKPTEDGNDIDHYTRKVGGVFKQVALEEIIHFRDPNPEKKFIGISVTEILVRAILSSWYIGEWNNRFFSRGAIPPGILSTEHSLNEDQIKAYKERWHNLHSGDKTHDIAILGAGLKFEQISASHKDMAFEKLCRMDREEIAAVTGVPPVILGDIEHANYANADAQIKLFWELTILPLLAQNESVINEMMIPRFWKGEGWFVEYDTSGIKVLQEDATAQAGRDQIYVNTGIKTVNEIRAGLKLEPVEWGDEPPSGSGGLTGLLSGETPALFKSLERKDDPEVERRKALWKAFDRKLRMRESKFQKIMRGYFIDQKKRLLAAIEEQGKSITVIKKQTVGPSEIPYGGIKDPPRPVNIDEIMALFVAAIEMLKLQQLTASTVEDILATAGKEAIGKLGVDVSFDVSDPKVIEWIKQKVLNLSTIVDHTSREKLRAMLTQAVDEGKTIKETSKVIGELFDGFADYRSDRIARTEVISAHNNGTIEGYHQSDVVEGKEWLATFDEATRDTHAMADGQVVDLNAPFNVGGMLMQYPGDPGAPVEEIVNCRCTVLPVRKEE